MGGSGGGIGFLDGGGDAWANIDGIDLGLFGFFEASGGGGGIPPVAAASQVTASLDPNGRGWARLYGCHDDTCASLPFAIERRWPCDKESGRADNLFLEDCAIPGTVSFPLGFLSRLK